MELTRRCDYALRILRAAFNEGDGFISVTDVSESEDIPYAFARSIQHDLVKNGLLKTVRGAHGGLSLNCDPSDVTLREVLEAVEGPVSVSLCAMDPHECIHQGTCAYNKLWMGANSLLNRYYESISLRDLLEEGGNVPAIREAIGDGEYCGKMCCDAVATNYESCRTCLTKSCSS